MKTADPGAIARAAHLFREIWSTAPDLVGSAPGRVNLIGEHTDYNDGFVLPMAIDRRTALAIGAASSQAGSGSLSLVSERHPVVVTVDALAGQALRGPDERTWANYVLGVFRGIADRMGEQPAVDGRNSFRIAVASDVPIGAGLSSSAALEVASAVSLLGLLGVDLPRADVALVCQQAEHRFAGVNCGIMDQMSSVIGNAVMLDCRSLEPRKVSLPSDASVLILDSGIPRGLSSSAYNERREQCEQGVKSVREHGGDDGVVALRDVTLDALTSARPGMSDVVFRRCRHVVTENRRVVSAADALGRGDMASLGKLMGESHESMRDDYEISLPDVDALVRFAAEPTGSYGARLTGAGFGGAVVAVAETSLAEDVASDVIERYRKKTGWPGSAFAVRSEEGARVDSVR